MGCDALEGLYIITLVLTCRMVSAEEAQKHETLGKRPSPALAELMGQDGINLNAMRMGPGKHLYGRKLPGGVKPEEFTYFHELVVAQELTRIGAPGYMGGLQSGM